MRLTSPNKLDPTTTSKEAGRCGRMLINTFAFRVCQAACTHRDKVGGESVDVIRINSDIGIALVHLCNPFIPEGHSDTDACGCSLDFALSFQFHAKLSAYHCSLLR